MRPDCANSQHSSWAPSDQEPGIIGKRPLRLAFEYPLNDLPNITDQYDYVLNIFRDVLPAFGNLDKRADELVLKGN